ncbi:MAG TPA: MFS transporter [Pseudolabrys sp.]|nr:MFS transporter [Pseudolabrys sp.]
MSLFHQLRFGFAGRLAAFYAAVFVLMGVQLPFLPVWLKAKGLDANLIGIALAAPMVARLVSVPLATRAADRHDALRAALRLTGLACIMGYALMALAPGPASVIATYTLVSLAFTPVMPLADTYALKGLAAQGRIYGPVRLWGSAAFIAGTFAAGLASDALPAIELIWLIVAASFGLAFAALLLAPLPGPATHIPATSAERRHLLRDPPFLAVLAAAALIQASHAVYYGFSSLAWRADGLSGSAIAALWALGVFAEIVLFACQGRLSAFISPTGLLMAGALGAVVRWGGMALDPPAYVLPLLQVLHALSFGATHLGAIGFIARHAPPGQSATAQGYLAIALGIAMAASMALAGWLYGAFGSAAYGAMVLAAVVGGGCALIAQRMRAREQAAMPVA